MKGPKLRRAECMNCAAYKWFIIRLKGKSEEGLHPLLKKEILFLWAVNAVLVSGACLFSTEVLVQDAWDVFWQNQAKQVPGSRAVKSHN